MADLEYPALVDLASQTPFPLRSSESFLVGRNETADLCVTDLTCSRHHFRIIKVDGKYFVEPLSPRNPTLCDGETVSQRQALSHEAVLQAGQCRFQFLLKAPTKLAKQAPPGSGVQQADSYSRTVAADVGALMEATLDIEEINLTGAMLIGREPGRVQIVLPSPQVSRVHANITLRGHLATISDMSSANGTYVNGARLTEPIVIRPGDQIDIGPYGLEFTGTTLRRRVRSDNIEIVAQGVTRVVTNRENGQPLTLLDELSLVIRPREFVCLLGPSGSGKSTLLSALSGRTPADGGTVLLNGRDLYANFDALKQDMAVVPQKDVLHDSLSIGQALWYTAKLRLPADTDGGEVENCLGEMLETVGLSARRATRIRDLSGGQVKRASLANEILCKPSLLFLDEVTSGLDEQTDREMMNLFRSLADAGKTVVCITHSLANVERACHLVAILTLGGKLAFFGKPAEALKYFRIERLGDVYDRLAEQAPEVWQAAFLRSTLYKRYVTERMPRQAAPQIASSDRPASGPGQLIRTFCRQSFLLTRRYWAIWRGDYTALLAMAGQSLLVGLLLAALFGNLDHVENPLHKAERTVNLIFLLAVTSFWFGCNNAAKEIVKERTIFTRECDFNLMPSSYYTSKLLLLALFSGVQVTMLFALVKVLCQIEGAFFFQWVVLLALAQAGVTLGLALSALARSEEVAITLVPMAIIPQIILSGVIAPLAGASKSLAVIGIATYWGKQGLDATLPDSQQGSIPGALSVLALHCVLALVIALLLLRRRRAGTFHLRLPLRGR